MARVPYVETASLPEDQQDLAPAHSHIFRALVHAPEALRHYKRLTKHIREENRLDPRLREMALVQIGYVAPCVYEYTHHLKTALRYGCSPEDLWAIADETEGLPTTLDSLTKTVLRAARELTVGYAVTDETLDALQRSLDPELLLELLFAVTTYTATIRLLLTLRVDLEDDYRPYLERFPIRTTQTR